MKKINTKRIDLGLIIIFTAIILRVFANLPDFIYGLGIGISTTLAVISIYEFRAMKKSTKMDR